jgi:hypothetical protein
MQPMEREGTTSALVHDLRGPASHVAVDVIDPRGTATPVAQALQQLAARPKKPGPDGALLLVAGIVVAATVVSAGIESWLPTLAALALAGATVIGGRLVENRARRTDRSTTWASRPGQAFGAWQPGVPAGRTRMLVDQRGLAVTDLTTTRRPLAVLLWRRITRLTIVPGREGRTVPGVVVHLDDGQTAVFTTSLGTHEVLTGLAAVGVLTDLQQAMNASPPVTSTAFGTPTPAPGAAPPTDAFPEAWARVTQSA